MLLFVCVLANFWLFDLPLNRHQLTRLDNNLDPGHCGGAHGANTFRIFALVPIKQLRDDRSLIATRAAVGVR